MKKKIKKKLELSKETLRNLSHGSLDQALGGATTSQGDAVTCLTCGACRTEFCTEDC